MSCRQTIRAQASQRLGALIILMALALSTSSGAFGQNQAGQQQPAQQQGGGGTGLDTQIDGPVDIADMPLQDVLRILQAESNLQFVPGENVNKNVSFTMQNPSIREILDTVLPANGLDWTVDSNGVVRIDTPEKIAELETPESQLVRRTFTPRFKDVTELQDALTGLKSPQGQIIIDPDSQKIIVEDVPEAVEAMEELIFQLDVETRTEVFPIKYGNAQEIADQLQGVVNTLEGEMFVDLRNNLIIIKDTVDRLAQARAIIEQLDRKLEIRVIPLNFSLPEDVLPLAEFMLSDQGFIDFDPRTSRVIIQDIPSIVDQIVEMIKQIDIPPQQVWIEAEIVQINNDNSFSFGTSAAFGDDIGGEDGNSPSSPVIGNTTDNQFFSFNPFLTTSGDGITLMDVNQGNFRFQIDALVEKNLAEVIASPRLMVEDGGFGTFTLGSQEPFAVRQQQTAFSTGGDFFTQQFREVGTTVSLEVYSNESGYINMFINVEDTRARRVQLANLGDGLAVDGSFIDTMVTVKSNRTVVLGGIINRETSSNRSGVPILSSIPVLGNLFSNQNKSSNKEKLLVFITPRLVNIDDPYDFTQVDNYQQIQDLRSSGATGFIETQVNEEALDWSAERENEMQAIEEAMEGMQQPRANTNGASSAPGSMNGALNGAPNPNANGGSGQSAVPSSLEGTSFQDQIEEGVIRVLPEDQ